MVSTIVEMRKELAHLVGQYGVEADCFCAGTVNARVAVVGEAPGYNEVKLKEPLVGGSGKAFFDALRKTGVTRNQLYLTNVIKRQLVAPSMGDGKQAIGKHEVQLWRDMLHAEIAMLPNCDTIIALGNHALMALTGKDKILNWRGSVLEIVIRGRPYKVICTINPAMVFREPKLEIVFRMDVAKLTRVLNGEFQCPVFRELINPTFNEACEFLDLTYARGLSGHFVSTDIESMAQETASVGFASSNDEAMCIAFRSQKDNVYSTEQECILRQKMQRILAHRDIKRIAQNGNFDAGWMGYKDHIRWGDIHLDTMLAHFTLYPALPHNLGFLTTQYTDHPYYKDDGKDWRDTDDIDGFWRYNCKDAVLTRMIAFKLIDELREQNMYDAYYNHVARLGKHLVTMTVNGVLIDQTLKGKLNEIFSADVARLGNEFTEAVRDATEDPEYTCNPNSPTQLGKLLFGSLRLVGRGASTGSENRDRMLANPRTNEKARRVLTVLGDYKEKAKFLSTYVESQIDPDGRMRCEYKQHGVVRAPGRLSSAKVLWGSGMNLQNQNEASKQMFIADDGYMLTYFDMAQIEARLVAYFANIESWKEQFQRDLEYRRGISNTPFDAHRALASDIWKLPYDDVPKEDFLPDGTKTIRYKAKRCLTDEHEVLTQRGWISIEEASQTNEPIMIQHVETGIFTYETPSCWFVDDVAEGVYVFHGERASLRVTGDHEMICIMPGTGNIHRKPATAVHAAPANALLPVAGVYTSGTVTHPYPRLLAASWSDGTIEKRYKNSVRISVTKDRKADRLHELCADYALDYWYSQTDDGMHHFRVYGFTEKSLPSDILDWDLETRQEFLSELPFWDGCWDTKRVFNTKFQDMQMIQTLAHITTGRATIWDHGTPKGNETQCYQLRLTSQQEVGYKGLQRTTEVYHGKVFCPTVSTGAFLVRRGRHISVSSNCRHGLNYRMEPDRFSTTAGLALSEARDIYDRYHRITPELKVWWQSVVQEARTNRCLFTPYGTRWINLGRFDDDALDSIIAFKPQSTAGVHVARVIYQCHEDPDWPRDARVILNIHDALIAMHRPEDRVIVRKIMRKYAEAPIMINGEPCIVPCDFARSEPDEFGLHRWSGLRKVKNDEE